MSQESELPLPARLLTQELLLAQALEACIQAERKMPGSAELIIAHQPDWARDELRRMVGMAGSLDAAASNAAMSEEFRSAARARLLRRIGGDTARVERVTVGAWLSAVPSANEHSTNGYRKVRSRRSAMAWRGGAGVLLSAVLVAAASVTASANALPGEALYGVKQAREELGLRLAPDDEARTLALLQQADARLEETARLLQAGRTNDVAQTTQRFDEVIDRATTTFVVTVADAPSAAPVTASMETRLADQQQQIQSMLQSAPDAARASLREALVATERSRALVADPQVIDRALGRPTTRASAAAAVPTVAAEEVPTIVPTEPAPQPTAPQIANKPEPAPAAPARAQVQAVDRRASSDSGAGSDSGGGAVVGRGQRAPAPAQTEKRANVESDDESNADQHADTAEAPVVALSGAGSAAGHDRNSNGMAAPSTSQRSSAPASANEARGGTSQGGQGRVVDGSGDSSARAADDSGDARGRGSDDSPQPAVVARQLGNPGPASAASADSGGDRSPPGRAGAQNAGVAAHNRSAQDGEADSRPAANTSGGGGGARVQATPTPSSDRRAGGGNNGTGGGDSSGKGSGGSNSANAANGGRDRSDHSGSGGSSDGGGGDHDKSDH